MITPDKLKIAICDDLLEEQQSVKAMLERYLDERELFAEIQTFGSGEEFLESDTSAYLLVILDIYMKELNGLDTAELLQRQNPRTQVVFCTTSREHAVEAFQLEALNYLVKPLEYSSFSKVMDKFFSFYTNMRTITIKVGRAREDVYLDDLVWMEADGKRTNIHTGNGTILASNPIAELQEMLPAAEFFRPIRWALVSLRRIKLLSPDHIIMSDDSRVPISRGERERIKQAYANFRWNEMRRNVEEKI